jgi:hypothetical protein
MLGFGTWNLSLQLKKIGRNFKRSKIKYDVWESLLEQWVVGTWEFFVVSTWKFTIEFCYNPKNQIFEISLMECNNPKT